MIIFQQRLIEQRTLNKYSKRGMAKMLGISHTAYMNYESGKAEPSQETLVKIAEIFDVSVDYLLGRKDL